MIPGIDPKIDYAFKRVFGLERNRAVLMHLVNAVLRQRQHAPVTAIELLNPFNEKETSDDKLSIVDLKARDQLGRQFNVEMQMLWHVAFLDRVLYYWSRLHASQLLEGQDYTQLQPTISICFLNHNLFPTFPDYRWCFRVRDERHPTILFSPHLEIHLIELPKFRLAQEDLHDPLDQWLYFLMHAERLDSDMLPPNLQVPEIQKAFEELNMVTQSERDRARYEERFKAELDARSHPIVMRETVRQEGRVEGDLIGRIRLCQRMLQQPQTSAEELFALPVAELERLAERLEQQALSGLRPVNGSGE